MPESKQQDAIALLKEDHRTVAGLFEQFDKAAGEGSKQDLLKEAYVEHDGAKVLIAQIQAGDGQSDEYFDAKVKVLQEQIEHHVEEEEKRMEGLFSQAREAGLDMDALGAQLADRKAELISTFEATGVPKPVLTTMTETV